MPLDRDDFFYFDSIVFQAENKLFKVPRYGLPAEEGVFTAMFELPTPCNRDTEGSSDENPIKLPPEVTAYDFRSLLKACYPQCVPLPIHELTVDEWMSVLKLANMWCLDGLRKIAIEKAEDIVEGYDSVQKILLGRHYTVARWMIDGYEDLGMRAEMISDEEREMLGLETYFGLVKLREQSWVHRSTASSANRAQTPPCNTPAFRAKNAFYYVRAIREIFKDELLLDRDYVPLS
ncbi:hypothetical protein OF83DRAFT_1073376 [Amylostereum chailletii]|nr:hypothetical protein OF83DRAFT_1073376 [Amylostereum chailletii]